MVVSSRRISNKETVIGINELKRQPYIDPFILMTSSNKNGSIRDSSS